METFTVETALRDKDLMLSSTDKKLYITLYGNLVNESFKKRVEEKEDINKIFDELCIQLEEIQLK
jgi:hypothetical protein